MGLAAVACGTPVAKDDSADKKEHEVIVNFVDTIVLVKGDFHSELISNGRLRASQKSDLKFSGSGAISTLNAENGQYIKAGAVIAELEHKQIQMSIEQAKMAMVKAELDLQDKLLGFGYSSKDTAEVPDETMRIARIRSGYDDALMALEKAEFEMKGHVLSAPISGKVANLKSKKHENPKGDFFCTIIDDSKFDVEFSVLESEVGSVNLGAAVKISTFNDPTHRYTGSISNINPTVDDKGQIIVTATLVNSSGGRLLDGMNVKVFVENSFKDKLVVPKSAVLIRDNREVLFTFGDDGKAHWTYVIVEASNSTSHSVRANTERGAELAAGASVIVSGNLNLADGSAVEFGKR